MDNTFGTIVSYRPDIKVVDCTIRDGVWDEAVFVFGGRDIFDGGSI